MKIFITGIAGFLGSHLADEFLSLGHEVIGVDNLIGGDMDNLNPRISFHKVDCLDLEKLNELISGTDIVYHAACTPHEGLSVFSPAKIVNNTFQITANTLSAAIKNKVKRFVQCSSMARYGQQDKIPFKEDMQCKPQDPYGIAKYASELLIKNLCDTHSIEYVITVPHNIIGARQKYDDPYRNVASIMTNRMLQNKPAYIYGDGEQMRCFTFIEDVISCLREAGMREGISGEIINIGPDSNYITINKLYEKLSNLLLFNKEPIYVKERPQEVKFATCSADKAKKLLGFKEKITLDDGLKNLVEYIKSKGPKPFRYHLDLEIINKKTPKTWSEKLI